MVIADITREGVLEAMAEHDRIGQEEFLEHYGFRVARKYFLLFKGMAYSSKAILGVGHKYSKPGNAALTSHELQGGNPTMEPLKRLGFNDFSSDPNVIAAYTEGARSIREATFFSRNPKLVRAAKELYGYVCQACDFDFEKTYGDLGGKYIECHHLNPIAERDEASLTRVKDVAVLCANCHRMVHRARDLMSVQDLRALIARQRKQPG